MRNPAKDLKALNIDKIIPDSKLFPVCVPSYQRPDAPILYELKKDPRIPVILFVRKTEKERYAKWKKYFKIVYLSGVSNIGETRRAIVKYLYKNGVSGCFMMDDDIPKFGYLVKGYTKTGNKKLMLQNYPSEACQISRDALKLWQYYISLCKDVALSGVVYRPFSWMWGNTKKPWMYNDGVIAQIFFVNVKLLTKSGINYRSNTECFNEDTCIQFEVMKAGLNTIHFKEFTYSVPVVGQIGGCSEMYGIDPNASKQENFERCIKSYTAGAHLLIDNIAKGHPGIVLKYERSGRGYAGFVWKYWRRPFDSVQKSENSRIYTK